MSEPAEPADLSTLDGNALVARLGVVKERVLGDSIEAHEIGSDTATTERADTEAVLDECAVRLQGPAVSTPGEPDAVSLAGAGATIDRLRGVIRAVVDHADFLAVKDCPICHGGEPGRSLGHNCSWTALVAEAEKR
jgi:hypothetical protein